MVTIVHLPADDAVADAALGTAALKADLIYSTAAEGPVGPAAAAVIEGREGAAETSAVGAAAAEVSQR